jgi:hypothetical protein
MGHKVSTRWGNFQRLVSVLCGTLFYVTVTFLLTAKNAILHKNEGKMQVHTPFIVITTE